MTDHLGGYLPGGDPWTWTPEVWELLVNELEPLSVLDIGCGEGHHTKWFLECGLNAFGVDGSLIAREYAVIPANRFLLHDFSHGPIQLPLYFDLVWCCEFVEHLEAEYLYNFLTTLQSVRYLAMTHAFPGQAGHHHVNCQHPGYWIAVMAGAGFVVHWDLTKASRLLVSSEKHWSRSGLVFVRR
jgi:SAM-dependent methyltransferase